MWSFPWAIQPVVWRKGINYDCTCVPRRTRGGCDIHCSLKGKIGCWGTARCGGRTILTIKKSHTQDIRNISLYNYIIFDMEVLVWQ